MIFNINFSKLEENNLSINSIEYESNETKQAVIRATAG
jgi:hypothetical protein